MPHDATSDRDISRFLSYVQRHAPQEAGLTLDEGGWTGTAALIAAAPMPLDAATLARIVAESDKQRFSLSPDGSRIRANQGHSVPVDLGLTPLAPPEALWHGTAAATLPAIEREGLTRQARHHVHLSADPETARRVGMRHGRPVVLRVAAGAMAAEGAVFFRSDNGVWLTEAVPWRFLTPEDC